MEQHHLKTKGSRPPQCRRLASDRKDRLRASLNAAKGSPAFCGWRFRTRRQRQRSKACNSHGVHALNSYLIRDGFHRAFHQNETSTKFPNAGSIEFPNALEIPIRAKQFAQQNQRLDSGWGGRDRTSEWRNQNPLPYRLATPQQAGPEHGIDQRDRFRHRRSIEGVTPFQQLQGRISSQNRARGHVPIYNGSLLWIPPDRFARPRADQYRPAES